MNEKLIDLSIDNVLSQLIQELLTSMFVKDARRIVQLIDVEKQNKKNGSEFISIINKYLATASKPLVISELIEDSRKTVNLIYPNYDEKEFNSVVGKYVNPIIEGMKKKHEELAND